MTGRIDPSVRDFVLNLREIGIPLESRVAFYRDGVIGAKFAISEDKRSTLRAILERAAKSGAMALSETAA